MVSGPQKQEELVPLTRSLARRIAPAPLLASTVAVGGGAAAQRATAVPVSSTVKSPDSGEGAHGVRPNLASRSSCAEAPSGSDTRGPIAPLDR